MSKSASSLSTFFRELRRRKVFQVAVVYAVVGWLLIQVADTIVPRLHLPPWAVTFILVLIIIGFPIALIVAWALELTPEGVKHTEALEVEAREKERIEPGLLEPSAAKPQPSIVVLPFDDISPGKENEYFSDGLTEEIITDLSYVHDLRVISRTSAMMLKGTQKAIKTIAQELDVQYVLEGSVRKVANDLRITAQLIDATSDAHLWAEKYSGTLDDVFDIQEKVSRSIVDALKMKLSPEEKKKIAERPIENVQAYECYLRAKQEMWRWSEEGLNRALQLIQNGLKIFGENELFYAALGTIYIQYINAAVKIDVSYLQKAEECAKKVFTLNPGSSHGYFLKGFINHKRGNVQEGVKDLKQSLKIDPNDPDTLWLLSGLYGFSGKGFAAEPLIRKALEVDPLNPIIYGIFSLCEMYEGKFEAALETWSKGYPMEPANPFFRFYYAFHLAYNHRFEKAYKYIDLLKKDTPQSIWTQFGLFLKYALQEDKTKALQSVTEELKDVMQTDELYSLWMADCYALIDEKEEALNWLENAVNRGFINYPFLNEYDPFLENIRGEKRFKKLMEKVKYEWEHFEV